MDFNKLFSLEGRVALVTGGQRGIGAMITEGFLAQGAKVYISGRKADQGEAAAAEFGDQCIYIQGDISTYEGCKALAAEIAAREDKLDILVNNAGVASGALIEDFPLEEFDRIVNINVRGVFATTQAAVPHLGEGGRIINIGSVNADRVPVPAFSVYALSKAAVAGFTRGLARELGPRGITVNNIQPGPIATDMNPAEGPLAEQMTPLLAVGHYGQTRDIASAVAFLASPESSYITGIALNVDGGFLI